MLINLGEEDDEVYDWNLLNDGRGWDAQAVRRKSIQSWIQSLTSIALSLQPGGSSNGNRREQDRTRRDEEQRRRSMQQSAAQQGQSGAVVPPSPALVRHGSKRRVPNALLSGGSGGTPQSGAAHVNVPISGQVGNPAVVRRLSTQQQGLGHPYASASGMPDYGAGMRPGAEDDTYGGTAYPRTSPMAAAAPPALSNVRAMGGESGVANENGYDQQHMMDHEPPKPPLLLRILTCRC